ncbi:hypothetical protein [Luteibacter sahnii]|uniref:hypothetical protein n=1 Tax=Luteibacter sahnii TaxID=3021977 RepID=UPI002A6B0D8E|nr:hypothetical protein [Luteibacter sp. PPL193]MDY1548551.1 hypothetical protein [Luteibacter sp. PPL193]
MRGLLTLSIVVGLGVAGQATAQSRTVSTADMPQPGVSYIAGPTVPVRRETVGTGSLPQPPHFYPGAPALPPPDDNDVPPDGGYANGGYNGGYVYGGYPPGYGYGDRGRDGDERGRPWHDHGHERHDRPQGTTATVRVPPGTRFGPPAGNARTSVAPPPPPPRHDHGGWHGGSTPPPPVTPLQNGR